MKTELEYIDKKIETLELHIANPTEYKLTPTIKVKIDDGAVYQEELETLKNIKQALTELQAIKEAKPSEALNGLKNIAMAFPIEDSEEYNAIKATLLKAEKLEKAWEVILGIIKNEEYGTQEELLKACEDVYGKGSKEYVLLKEMTK